MSCPQCLDRRCYQVSKYSPSTQVWVDKPSNPISVSGDYTTEDVPCHVCTEAPNPQCSRCLGWGWYEVEGTGYGMGVRPYKYGDNLLAPQFFQVPCLCTQVQYSINNPFPFSNRYMPKWAARVISEKKRGVDPGYDKLIELGWLR